MHMICFARPDNECQTCFTFHSVGSTICQKKINKRYDSTGSSQLTHLTQRCYQSTVMPNITFHIAQSLNSALLISYSPFPLFDSAPVLFSVHLILHSVPLPHQGTYIIQTYCFFDVLGPFPWFFFLHIDTVPNKSVDNIFLTYCIDYYCCQTNKMKMQFFECFLS